MFLPCSQAFKPGCSLDAALWHTTSKGFRHVIRITTQQETNGLIVTIDGQVEESDLREIRRVRKSAHGAVLLNLRGVDACAAGGVQLLRDWLDTGARLQDATPFLRMLLEKPSA